MCRWVLWGSVLLCSVSCTADQGGASRPLGAGGPAVGADAQSAETGPLADTAKLGDLHSDSGVDPTGDTATNAPTAHTGVATPTGQDTHAPLETGDLDDTAHTGAAMDTGAHTGADTGLDSAGDTGVDGTGGLHDGTYIGIIEVEGTLSYYPFYGFPVECTGTLVVVVNHAASPQIAGGGSCDAVLVGALDYTLEGNFTTPPYAEGTAIELYLETDDEWSGLFDGDTFLGTFEGDSLFVDDYVAAFVAER